MNIQLYLTLLQFSIPLYLVFGGGILLFSHIKPAKYFFSAVIGALLLWTIGIVGFWTSAIPELWMKQSFFSMAFSPLFLFLFVWYYPKRLRSLSRVQWSILLGVPIGFAVLSLSTAIVYHIEAPNKIIYGTMHPFYMGYIFTYSTLTLVTLLYRVSKSQGIERVRLKYFLIILLSAIVATSITNGVLPLLGNNNFNQYGPLFSAAFLLSCGYSMLKFRLLDIQIIIKRSVLYVCLIGFFCLSFFILAFQFNSPERYMVVDASYLGSILFSVLLVVFLYPYLREALDHLTDRFFYQRQYDYQETLKSFNLELEEVVSKKRIIDIFAKTVFRVLKSKKVALYLLSPDNRLILDYSESMVKDHKLLPRFFELGSVFDTFLKKKMQSFMFTQEVEVEIESDDQFEIKEFLVKHGFSLSIKLSRDSQFVGVLFLAEKRSETLYTEEDIHLLETMINYMVTAIQSTVYFDKLQSSIYKLELLNQFSVQSSQSHNHETLFSGVKRTLKQLYPFNKVLIYTNQNGQFKLFNQSLSQKSDSIYNDFPVEAYLSDNSQLFKSTLLTRLGQPLIQAYCQKIAPYCYLPDTVVIPITKESDVVAVMVCVTEAPIVDQDLSLILLDTFAQQISIVIRNVGLESSIHASHSYHQQFLDNMVTGVILCDESLKISGINKIAQQFLGVKGNLLGIKLSLLSPLKSIYPEIKKVLQSGFLETKELKMNTGVPSVLSLIMGR
ncbi:hypothetical protein DID77_04670, partial [Candidatus Marinamargulisbacteria bacterium SCGC AG-439-L15]